MGKIPHTPLMKYTLNKIIKKELTKKRIRAFLESPDFPDYTAREIAHHLVIKELVVQELLDELVAEGNIDKV